MVRNRLLLLCLVGLLLILGCSKKAEETALPDQMQQEGAALTEQGVPAPEGVAGAESVVTPAAVTQEAGIPPASVSVALPTAKDIQQALKNAGLYTGEIDGKIGPKTKKAIEEFQAQNNLKADGKVGPKTWAVLKSFLVVSSVASES